MFLEKKLEVIENFPFINYNGDGLQNPEILLISTKLEVTSEVARSLSQSSEGVGGCSWAFIIPK